MHQRSGFLFCFPFFFFFCARERSSMKKMIVRHFSASPWTGIAGFSRCRCHLPLLSLFICICVCVYTETCPLARVYVFVCGPEEPKEVASSALHLHNVTASYVLLSLFLDFSSFLLSGVFGKHRHGTQVELAHNPVRLRYLGHCRRRQRACVLRRSLSLTQVTEL